MSIKHSNLFVAAIVFTLAFVACDNNSDIEKPEKIISDSTPLDSVSADILKDPLPASSITVPVSNKDSK